MALTGDSGYELFFRTASPETRKAPALAALMKSNDWTSAVILSSTDSVWMQVIVMANIVMALCSYRLTDDVWMQSAIGLHNMP